MRTIVSEDFSGYSDGNLATVGSARWRQFASAHFGDLTVASHALAPHASLDGADIIKSAVWGAASQTYQWSQITLGAAGDFKGCGVFGEDTSHTSGNGYYLESTGSSLAIMKIIDGSFNAIYGPLGIVVSPADVLFLSGELISGGTNVHLELFQNGVLKLSGNDASWLGGGIPFARMWYATGGSRITNFQAGDFAAPAAGNPFYLYQQQRQMMGF